MDVLEEGQQFAGRYRIVKRLASGGMGAVYVAVQEVTELKVALKVLWPHVLQSADAAERFSLESRVAARIRSENIVQVFDAGFDEASRMPFLVMELLEGATLEQWIAQKGPLSAELSLELLSQVARALDKAHGHRDANGVAAPIVHRDLKPENLFVTVRENGERVVKVLDFGIAKVLRQSTAVTQVAIGTPTYMAYEQAQGQAVSPQTDIWALGLIAYYMLTGGCYWKSPRNADGEIRALFAEIIMLPLEPASQRAAQHTAVRLPPDFDRWFQTCVNRDATLRFATAGQAVRELAICLLGFDSNAAIPSRSAQNPVSARSPTSRVTSLDEPRPHPNGSSAAPELVLVDDTMVPSVVSGSSQRKVPWRFGVTALGIVGVGIAAILFLDSAAVSPPDLAADAAGSGPTRAQTARPGASTTPPKIQVAEAAEVAVDRETPAKPTAIPKVKRPPLPRRVKPAPKVVSTAALPTAVKPTPPADPLAGPRR